MLVTPDVVIWRFGRQDLPVGVTRPPGEVEHGCRADEGPDRLRVGADPALRKAPDRAGGGEEALDLVAGRCEGLGRPLVHDQDRAARPHRGASVPQRLDRPWEIVHALDEEHQVVAWRPVGRFVCQVSNFQVHPIGDAVAGGMLPADRDGRLIVVQAVHPDVGECLR